ncbi:peptide-methionine (S)-S-oxide reductase, partial [Pseudomonas syringae]|uniref:peptide-methionine (S)-S-oxide reductase n=1 Tax=Pseudomonas syringae TaxID=317 RepID=UPI00073EAF2D
SLLAKGPVQSSKTGRLNHCLREQARSHKSSVYFAEAYHQQYLAKNPQGYCGLGGTGVCLPA